MEDKNLKLEKAVKRSKRFTIFWFLMTLFFAAAVTAMFFVGWWMNRENAKTNLSVENLYRHSFYELHDSMANMEVVLSKLTVIDDGAMAAELTLSCYRQAEIAATELSIIPIDQYRVQKTEKFLNQVADWSRAYNQALSMNAKIAGFSNGTEKLLSTVKNINLKLKDGLVQIENGYSFRLNYGTGKILPDSEAGGEEKKENSVEYPELIYDGPFSDTNLKKSYKALESLKAVDEEAAKEVVKKALKNIEISDITLIGGGDGETESFEFLINTNNGEAYATISKKGGMPLQLLINRSFGTLNLADENELKERAKEVLNELNLKGMEPVWVLNSGGATTINFAPKSNNVIYYTDLVKVKMAPNGDLLGLEMTGYAKNHCSRTLENNISEKKAMSLVKGKMEIESVRQVVIPLRQSEELCYEVIGKKDGLDFFVYVSAESGEVVNILRVIDSNQGRLVI